MDVTKFPFDSQTCQIRFSLPIFSYLEVKIYTELYEGINNYSMFEVMVGLFLVFSSTHLLKGNSEWELINLTNRVDFLTYNDRFDVELAVYEIKIARNPLYYFYMIVFPSFVINSVSIVGVFIKGADKMSRVGVLNFQMTPVLISRFLCKLHKLCFLVRIFTKNYK